MARLRNGWDFEVELITPERAARLLEGNRSNRRLRQRLVDKYAAMMTAGDWKVTPESIQITADGRLLNGQHRLHAVVKSGVPVSMLVVKNVKDDVFSALDRGAVRSAADALSMDIRLAGMARLAVVIGVTDAVNKHLATDADIAAAADMLREESSRLQEYCGACARTFSSTAFRLAAVARIIGGADRDYVYGVYRNLVLGNVAELPPIAQYFVGFVASGKTARINGSSNQAELLTRAWVLFDESKKNNTRVQIRDQAYTAREIKEALSKGCK